MAKKTSKKYAAAGGTMAGEKAGPAATAGDDANKRVKKGKSKKKERDAKATRKGKGKGKASAGDKRRKGSGPDGDAPVDKDNLDSAGAGSVEWADTTCGQFTRNMQDALCLLHASHASTRKVSYLAYCELASS